MGNVDLDGIPLFAGLAAGDRDRVTGVARQLHWEVGHVALREGEFAFDFYAIRHGAVEVQHAGEPVATLGAGDFFGEIGLAPRDLSRPSRRRSATVVVTEPTDAVSIAASDLRSLSEAIPALREALERATAERSQT
jgi:CRP/FNR family transcriptional regulator, cyclic AMP receptor protein